MCVYNIIFHSIPFNIIHVLLRPSNFNSYEIPFTSYYSIIKTIIMSNTTTPPNNDNNDDDQDLANNLQEQYRLEFLQRQARKNSQARATAPIGMMGETSVAAVVAADGDIEIDLSSTNMNNTDNDADLARRLQEEFNGGTTTTTSAFGYTVGADDHRISINPFDRLEDNTNTNTTTNNNNNDDDEDARMAQQLQDEEWARQYSQMEQSSQRQRQQLRGQHTTTSSSSFLDEQDDAATRDARRIAQEMNDAEIAQRLTLYEQEALTRRQVLEAQQQNQQNTRTQFWMGRLLPLLCCAGILTITLLFVFDVLDSEDISFFRGFDPDDWVESDPWSGGGGGSTDDNIRNDDFTPVQDDESFRWQNDGKSGLKLEILNALDDSWQSTFQKAVADWDNGMPIDALILTTKQVDYDMSCKAVQGKLKVCNGNYGDTRWRGLNEVLLSRNRIESSSAKMNEYYLKHDNDDQKLYTMCHEVGKYTVLYCTVCL